MQESPTAKGGVGLQVILKFVMAAGTGWQAASVYLCACDGDAGVCHNVCKTDFHQHNRPDLHDPTMDSWLDRAKLVNATTHCTQLTLKVLHVEASHVAQEVQWVRKRTCC
jgi:hypothetical protein